jgi:hypothetical protein
MRFTLPATLIAASFSTGAAFAPAVQRESSKTALFNTLKARPTTASIAKKAANDIENSFRKINDASNEIVPLTGEEINARLNAQLEKLREKDRNSKELAKEVCFLILDILCVGIYEIGSDQDASHFVWPYKSVQPRWY